MALQDLTPQLRTRLNKVEWLVGWFVIGAAVLFISGFVYYVYDAAKRKGWFRAKAPYFTLVQSGAGLRPGDPVYLMGFEVGRITRVEAMPPWHEYNVYVEFEIVAPYFGYVWTEGSVARVQPADFFGKRSIEVTKGTGGFPTYINFPLKEVSLSSARKLVAEGTWVVGENIVVGGTNLVVRATTKLSEEVIDRIEATGKRTVLVVDISKQKARITAVWDESRGRFSPYLRTNKPYWLREVEFSALSDRIQAMVARLENALPSIVALTNQAARVLESTVCVLSNVNMAVNLGSQLISNVNLLVADLEGEGALGRWFLGQERVERLDVFTGRASETFGLLNSNLSLVAEDLRSLINNLNRGVTNVNAQLAANTNLLTELNRLVVDTDDLIQGLKRHWLFRSAFKPAVSAQGRWPTNRLTSPKERER